MEYIAIAEGLLALYNQIAPKLQELAQKGQLTPEQEQRYIDLYNNSEAVFDLPEYQKKP